MPKRSCDRTLRTSGAGCGHRSVRFQSASQVARRPTTLRDRIWLGSGKRMLLIPEGLTEIPRQCLRMGSMDRTDRGSNLFINPLSAPVEESGRFIFQKYALECSSTNTQSGKCWAPSLARRISLASMTLSRAKPPKRHPNRRAWRWWELEETASVVGSAGDEERSGA
jgi:hypothetical protein